MSDTVYEDALEQNVYDAIKALESERFYEFTADLLRLLEVAKHSNRLMWSMLMQVTGTPREATERELARAERDHDWFREPKR